MNNLRSRSARALTNRYNTYVRRGGTASRAAFAKRGSQGGSGG